VVRAFIAGGANVKNPVAGISLLQVARGKDVFEALISAGADVNGKPGNNLYPPILWAAELGDTDSLTMLIKAGAKVNSKSSDGTTALMVAAESGVPQSVKLLLSAGADAAQKDKDGETALDYARHAEERNADEEAHPGPFSGPIPEFRAKFEDIKKLLASSQQRRMLIKAAISTGKVDLRATVRSHRVYRGLSVPFPPPDRPPQFSLSVPMTLGRQFRRSISQTFSSTGQVLGLSLHLAQLPRSLERESLPLSFWLLRS
jgi:hypothetical protein